MFLKMFTKKHSENYDEFDNKNFLREVFMKENIIEDLKLILDFQKKNQINKFFSFGCGNGVLESILYKYFKNEFKISCYDINFNQIEYIKSKLNLNIFNHFDFINGDFDNLDIEKNQINCAFFSRSLYVCNEANLNKIFENLKQKNFRFILDIHDGCFTAFNLVPHLLQNLKYRLSKRYNLKMQSHGYAKNFNHYESIIRKNKFEILFKNKNNKNEPIFGIKI